MMRSVRWREPIIRYSLGLSDDDLLDLITRYPQDWQTISIAQRRNLSEALSDAVLGTNNLSAGQALLSNDVALIGAKALTALTGNKDYTSHLGQRNSFARRLKRDIFILTERKLYDFLRGPAHLDRATAKNVMKTVQRRVEHQEHNTDPAQMSEEELKDAVQLGENDVIVKAFAARARASEAVVKRMILTSAAAKPVIALCVKAGFSMSFAVLIQQRLTRLAPPKILYPKNGSECPISPTEVQWQLEFFGI